MASKYISFRDNDSKGELQYYILQRDYPHYVARISYKPSTESLMCVPVTDHLLWLIFDGVLAGNYIPAHPSVKQELAEVFFNMATWFYSNRIVGNESKYKKWRVKT